MNKTWMPIAAGVIDLFIGAVEMLVAIIGFWLLGLTYNVEFPGIWEFLIKSTIPFSIPFFFAGIFALIGSVCAFRRKRWELAFTAPIMAFVFLVLWLCSSLWFGYPIGYLTPSIILLLGIVAIVLTVLSRKEFEQREQLGHILKKTWKPIAAGILEICGGVIQLLFAIIYLIASIFSEGYNILREEETYLITTLFVLSIFLAIIGSIYSLRRTNWPLAMTGAIAASALLPIFIGISIEYGAVLGGKSLIYAYPYTSPGIAAIVLTVLSKKEFKK